MTVIISHLWLLNYSARLVLQVSRLQMSSLLEAIEVEKALETNLFRARAGEAILLEKVNGGDLQAVVSGFLLAFSLSELLGVDVEAWSNRSLANAFVISLASSSAFGFSCILLFTFLSAKIRRLVGKSGFLYGGHGDADIALLRRIHGDDKVTSSLEEKTTAQGHGEVRFAARSWYYGTSGGSCACLTGVCGREHFQCGQWSFSLQLVIFSVAIVLYLVDQCNDWVAVVSSAVLVAVPSAAFARLYASGALHDLA